MQQGQHVDDRSPVAVIDQVPVLARRGVEVRKQRQGISAVHRADDRTCSRRHGSDDESRSGVGCEPGRSAVTAKREPGTPRDASDQTQRFRQAPRAYHDRPGQAAASGLHESAFAGPRDAVVEDAATDTGDHYQPQVQAQGGAPGTGLGCVFW